MTIRFSAGLRTAVLSDYGIGAMMNYGTIEVYSGEQPASASLAPSGTLLARITNDGDTFQPGTTVGALQLEMSADGSLVKSGVWRMKGVAAGTASWWRWKWNSVDAGGDSFSIPRMDGAEGESLQLAVKEITEATDVVITNFEVNILE
tara:strand:+ start:1601 stop:2044 length:444 start_codon:yes stop_codon:yes gene_type:complete